MGGFFAAALKEDCVFDLFYGTDYHSHLGTRRAGLAVYGKNGFNRAIHNIENAPFRSKFTGDLKEMEGNVGIGCISDYDPQPLLVRSHHGTYAITTVGKINGPLHAMKSGLGIWACESEGVKCGAVAVVNALGDVLKDGQIIAGCTDNDGSFADSQKILMERVNEDQIIDRAANTTLVCVITNAKVTKSEANKVAQVMHDGLADSICPVHTNADGDATFCMTSGEVKVNADALSAMARLATKNAIVNAALNAGDAYGLPAAK